MEASHWGMEMPPGKGNGKCHPSPSPPWQALCKVWEGVQWWQVVAGSPVVVSQGRWGRHGLENTGRKASHKNGEGESGIGRCRRPTGPDPVPFSFTRN